MPRIALVLVIALVLALPAAAALGSGVAPSVGVGPRGPVTGGGEPYYLLVHVLPVEAPREGDAKDDCSSDNGARPPPLEAALLGLAQQVASWDPAQEPRISGWYPRCFAGTLLDEHAPVWGRVSYDLPTGRYYVELTSDIPTTGAPFAFNAATELRLTGTTGVGTEADCETCPPPCC